jgi:hypothetical protein
MMTRKTKKMPRAFGLDFMPRVDDPTHDLSERN